MRLVIGTPAWSTWSLRPWLALRRAGAAFETVTVPLRRGDETRQAIQAVSPSGKVPVLQEGELLIWDSLAICEYVAERFAAAQLWPADAAARALARSAAAEMHSGFPNLRNECPMALDEAPAPRALTDPTAAEVRRIVDLWSSLRRRYRSEGPFLTGRWSIADAFYAPVATRFRTYQVDLAAHGDEGEAQAYAEALLATPEFQEWQAMARGEGG
jgi:glutathione S-transferase